MNILLKSGYIVKTYREPNEPYERFIERVHFIAKQQPKTKEEYDEVVIYSKIYANIKYLKCEYNKEVMDRLNQMQK